MRTHYLSFTRENVRRLLAGTKTQTRRVMRRQPPFHGIFQPHPIAGWIVNEADVDEVIEWAPARPGDLLGVLEDYRLETIDTMAKHFAMLTVTYLADGNSRWVTLTPDELAKWKARKRPFAVTPGRYMYRPSLVRLWYPILSVTPEWLQDISLADANAENCAIVAEYRELWDSINPAPERRWSMNPAVWRWEFDVTKGETP